MRPAQVAEGARATAGVIHPLRKDRVPDRGAEGVGVVLGEGLKLVKALDEEDVGDLLDDLHRVGHAVRPEGVPHPIDLRLELVYCH